MHRPVQQVARDVRVTLQRFMGHHPQTFTGGGGSNGGRPLVHEVEKVLEPMEITSDTTRIRLATFQLEGEAQVW